MAPSPNRSTFSLPDIDFGEDIDVVVGVTAAAATGDQLYKAAKHPEHRAGHLLGAGVGAAVTYAAWKLFRKEHREHEEHRKHKHHQGGGDHQGHHSDEKRDRSRDGSRDRLPPFRRSEDLSRDPPYGYSRRHGGAVGFDRDDDYNDQAVARRRRNSVHEFTTRPFLPLPHDGVEYERDYDRGGHYHTQHRDQQYYSE